MKCIICKTGDLQEGTTTTTMLERDTTIVVFKGVLALVCNQCGKSYTDGKITAKLLNIVEEKARTGPVEEFVQYLA